MRGVKLLIEALADGVPGDLALGKVFPVAFRSRSTIDERVCVFFRLANGWNCQTKRSCRHQSLSTRTERICSLVCFSIRCFALVITQTTERIGWKQLSSREMRPWTLLGALFLCCSSSRGENSGQMNKKFIRTFGTTESVSDRHDVDNLYIWVDQGNTTGICLSRLIDWIWSSLEKTSERERDSIRVCRSDCQRLNVFAVLLLNYLIRSSNNCYLKIVDLSVKVVSSWPSTLLDWVSWSLLRPSKQRSHAIIDLHEQTTSV